MVRRTHDATASVETLVRRCVVFARKKFLYEPLCMESRFSGSNHAPAYEVSTLAQFTRMTGIAVYIGFEAGAGIRWALRALFQLSFWTFAEVTCKPEIHSPRRNVAHLLSNTSNSTIGWLQEIVRMIRVSRSS